MTVHQLPAGGGDQPKGDSQSIAGNATRRRHAICLVAGVRVVDPMVGAVNQTLVSCVNWAATQSSIDAATDIVDGAAAVADE